MSPTYKPLSYTPRSVTMLMLL